MKTLTLGDKIYIIEKKLGRGGFGTVYLARNAQGDYVAIKEIVMRRGIAADIINESVNLAELKHDHICNPNISCYYEHHIDVAAKRGYIIMEYVRGYELDVYLDQFTGPRKNLIALYIFYVVSRVLDYIHQKGILHLDLKPENLLVSDLGFVKIVDFGISCLIQTGCSEPNCQTTNNASPRSWQQELLSGKDELGGEENMTQPCCQQSMGTEVYVAPETWTSGINYPSTDIWLLGATMYTCLTGQYISNKEARAKWDKCQFSIPRLKSELEKLDKLINACLLPEPSERITTREIIDELRSFDFETEFRQTFPNCY